MDNNNLFDQNSQNNSNLGSGVSDLLTGNYKQNTQQGTPGLGGSYSSNFGQDAFALRQSMQQQATQQTQGLPPRSGAETQPAYSQPNTSYVPTGYPQPNYSQPDPGYSQVPPVQPYNYAAEPDVSVGEWLLSMILAVLPCVGQILLIVWAFGSNTAPSKRNWARAMLIVMLIGLVLSMIFMISMGALFLRAFQYFGRF